MYESVKWTSIGSGNYLPPVRCQAITWTNDALLSMWPLAGNKFKWNEIRIGISLFLFQNTHLKCSSATVEANFSRENWVEQRAVGNSGNKIYLRLVIISMGMEVSVWRAIRMLMWQFDGVRYYSGRCMGIAHTILSHTPDTILAHGRNCTNIKIPWL